MKRTLLCIAALALLAASATSAAAKDNKAADDSNNKRVAVLSLAGYDRVMEDLDFLGGLAGNPGLSKNLEGAIQLFTQGQGLAGLDKKRPWGVTVTTDGAQFQPLVLLPVTNLKQLLDALAGLIGDAQEADGMFELSVFNFKIYAKEQNGWAFIGQSAEALSQLPKDPTKLLEGLDKSYDIALRLHVQNVPEVYRSLVMDQLQMRVDAGTTKRPDETDEAFAARKAVHEKMLDTLTKVVGDLDQLTLGWAIDTAAKSTHIDIMASAVSGTDTAKYIAQMKTGRSDFSGFFQPDASVSLNLNVAIGKESVSQFLIALQSIRTSVIKGVADHTAGSDETTRTLAMDIVGELFDAIQGTLEGGKIDGAASVRLADKASTLVAGGYIAQPKVLEDALKKLDKLLAGKPDYPGIKFDAAKHGDVRFHTVSIPVPQDQPVPAQVLGDKLDIAVGIGTKSAYLAVGKDSLNLVKQAIDKSKADASKPTPPAQLNVSMAPIFDFAASIDGKPEVKAIAERLAAAKGKDKLRVIVKPQGDELLIRVDAEQGVIELVARAIASSGAVAPAGAP